MNLKFLKVKEIFFLLFLISSLLLGFLLNEDTLGGAKNDFYSAFERTIYFKENILFYLRNYEILEYRHSPVFFVFSAAILELLGSEELYRLFHLIIPFIIFIFLFKCFILKFKDIEKNKLILISSIIFLSPTIRSYSIWPDSYLYGLLFFIIAIYHYLVFINSNTKFFNIYQNIIFLSLSSYFMPVFSVFSFYFFINFVRILLNKKLYNKVYLLILFNLLLAVPAFYYIFYLDINFLQSSGEWGLYEKTFSILNVSNKFFYSSCIIFFHLIPFVIIFFKNLKQSFFIFSTIKFYIFTIFLLTTFYFTDYQNIYINLGGGGIFYQIFDQILNFPELQLILIIPISFLFVFLFKNSINNYLLLSLLIFSNFQLTIYHNYFEPILYILFLTLINNENTEKIFYSKNKIYILILFSISYFLISFVK